MMMDRVGGIPQMLMDLYGIREDLVERMTDDELLQAEELMNNEVLLSCYMSTIAAKYSRKEVN